jgi:hypothetical protein
MYETLLMSINISLYYKVNQFWFKVYNLEYSNFYLRSLELSVGNSILYLHIPKTGGSNFRESLSQFNKKSNIKIITIRHFRYINLLENKKIIFTIRDPISRFVSSFNSRMNEDKPYGYTKHSIGEMIAFKWYHDVNKLCKDIYSKNIFNLIKSRLALVWIRQINLLLYIITPLSFLKKKPLFIFDSEFLQSDIHFFLKHIGVNKELKLFEKKSIKSHPTSYSKNFILTNDSKKILQRYLKEDYKIYLYCKNIRQKIIDKKKNNVKNIL